MKFKYFFLLLTFLMLSNYGTAQEITMFPGFWKMKYYEDNNEISAKQVESLLSTDVEANRLWQKSKKHMTIGIIAVGAQVGFLIWQVNKRNNFESQTVPLIGGLTSAGVAIGFLLSSGNSKKKAILQYNHSKDMGSLHLGPTRNGMGFVWSF